MNCRYCYCWLKNPCVHKVQLKNLEVMSIPLVLADRPLFPIIPEIVEKELKLQAVLGKKRRSLLFLVPNGFELHL